MTQEQNRGYTTENEKSFLDQLGNHGQYRRDPVELLRKYIKAGMARPDWGQMDKLVVLDHARALLRSYPAL